MFLLGKHFIEAIARIIRWAVEIEYTIAKNVALCFKIIFEMFFRSFFLSIVRVHSFPISRFLKKQIPCPIHDRGWSTRLYVSNVERYKRTRSTVSANVSRDKLLVRKFRNTLEQGRGFYGPPKKFCTVIHTEVLEYLMYYVYMGTSMQQILLLSFLGSKIHESLTAWE